MESVSEAVGDATIVSPMIRTALIHSKRSRESKTNSKTYFYNFAYNSNEENGSDMRSSSSLHGQEVPYIFGVPLLSPSMTSSLSSSNTHLGVFDTRKYTRSEAALSETVMNYWINFVRSG
jgi:carboxylesterase type B